MSIRLQFGSLHKDALELGPWYETPCCFVRVLILSVDVRMVCRSRTTVRESQLYKRHYFPPVTRSDSVAGSIINRVL